MTSVPDRNFSASVGRDEEGDILDEAAAAERKEDERHKSDDVDVVAAGGAPAGASVWIMACQLRPC